MMIREFRASGLWWSSAPVVRGPQSEDKFASSDQCKNTSTKEEWNEFIAGTFTRFPSILEKNTHKQKASNVPHNVEMGA